MIAADDEFAPLIAFCDDLRKRMTPEQRARVVETARYCGARARADERARHEGARAAAFDEAAERDARRAAGTRMRKAKG